MELTFILHWPPLPKSMFCTLILTLTIMYCLLVDLENVDFYLSI